MRDRIQDRFGMPRSTSSTAAAECWQEGIDRLLSQNHGPDLKFQEAIELDEGFAIAHGGLAFWYTLLESCGSYTARNFDLRFDSNRNNFRCYWYHIRYNNQETITK